MGMAHVLLAAALAMVAAAATVSAWPAEGIQPLSKIAMNKATVNLHGSAYVRATPALLGDQDEDTVWVTVKYGWENPSADDWIAVFSPADFISGSCPNPSRYPGEPLLCTAPIKYQYANYSANYLHGGKGAIRFQLINQRSDFSFALLAGGLENPTLVAVSKQVAFKNPKAPVFPRLAQGKTHDEMTVTWTSGYDIGEAYPFVEWGVVASGGNPTRTPAGTLTFSRGSMCGTSYSYTERRLTG
uniref:Purple acid phosphatase Fn3-like domain-containing protein n=1 Tax=Aegilops tauschii subsp. strangulata TaxID=200361 RepID=A0A453RMB9_AEGTS